MLGDFIIVEKTARNNKAAMFQSGQKQPQIRSNETSMAPRHGGQHEKQPELRHRKRYGVQHSRPEEKGMEKGRGFQVTKPKPQLDSIKQRPHAFTALEVLSEL